MITSFPANRLHSSTHSDSSPHPQCRICDWRQAIIKNGRHILDLGLGGPAVWQRELEGHFGLLSERCTSLTALRCDGDSMCRELFPSLKKIFVRNPELQSLEIGGLRCLEASLVLSNLKKLVVTSELTAKDVLYLLDVFLHLEELTFVLSDRPWACLNGTETFNTDLVRVEPSHLKRLRVLRIEGYADIGSILSRCPNIEHICFDGAYANAHSITDVLPSGVFSRLTSLSFHDSEAWPGLLAALPPHQLRNLSIYCIYMSKLLDILECQYMSLEHLDLSCSITCECSMAIFTKCVALKTLKLNIPEDQLDDLRFIIFQPWGCTLLEELEFPLMLSRSFTGSPLQKLAALMKTEVPAVTDGAMLDRLVDWGQAQDIFMERLGTLTRLRRLVLSKTSAYISWRLDSGLSRLQNLDRLEVLHLGRQQYFQGVDELQWMKRNFPRLLKLVVSKIEDDRMLEWLLVHWPELTVVELANVEEGAWR
ncbi:hypothetical protein DFQ27_007854 [Actinomortierella ambigua]|uniref:Uncharacterized protein n=1 Tax=Actinomortierella ambigua TaxID=1343610 RepID=A0A9P6PRY8_9FUNG|nr:hypothetical protein DFQ27_007854 [Actinomortierella ambigua]